MNNRQLRSWYERNFASLGLFLANRGFTANFFSTLSILTALFVAVAYYYHYPWLAAILILLTGFFDMLDGSVARAAGTASKFGTVLDHCIDRYAEYLFLLGVMIGDYADPFWVLFAFFGMIMASYVRAKAESMGSGSCSVGIAERKEKLSLLILGSLLVTWFEDVKIPIIDETIGLLELTVILIGILSHISAIQRIAYAKKLLST